MSQLAQVEQIDPNFRFQYILAHKNVLKSDLKKFRIVPFGANLKLFGEKSNLPGLPITAIVMIYTCYSAPPVTHDLSTQIGPSYQLSTLFYFCLDRFEPHRELIITVWQNLNISVVFPLLALKRILRFLCIP